MSTIRNGKLGLLETPGTILWQEDNDLRYFEEIHGNCEEIGDKREFMIEQLEENFYGLRGGPLDRGTERLAEA